MCYLPNLRIYFIFSNKYLSGCPPTPTGGKYIVFKVWKNSSYQFIKDYIHGWKIFQSKYRAHNPNLGNPSSHHMQEWSTTWFPFLQNYIDEQTDFITPHVHLSKLKIRFAYCILNKLYSAINRYQLGVW